MKKIKDNGKEVLLIAQEECAEVIQAISKIFRFGIDSEHNGVTNREHLEEEIGDLLCMIDLLVENEIVSTIWIEKAFETKREKLRKWSNILK